MTEQQTVVDILYLTRYKGRMQALVAELKRLKAVEERRNQECLILVKEINHLKSNLTDNGFGSLGAEKYNVEISMHEEKLAEKEKKILELQVQNDLLKKLNIECEEVNKEHQLKIYELTQMMNECKEKDEKYNTDSLTEAQYQLMDLYTKKHEELNAKVASVQSKLLNIKTERNAFEEKYRNFLKYFKIYEERHKNQLDKLTLLEKDIKEKERQLLEHEASIEETKLCLANVEMKLHYSETKHQRALKEIERLQHEKFSLIKQINAMATQRNKALDQVAAQEFEIDKLKNNKSKELEATPAISKHEQEISLMKLELSGTQSSLKKEHEAEKLHCYPALKDKEYNMGKTKCEQIGEKSVLNDSITQLCTAQYTIPKEKLEVEIVGAFEDSIEMLQATNSIDYSTKETELTKSGDLTAPSAQDDKELNEATASVTKRIKVSELPNVMAYFPKSLAEKRFKI